MKIFIRQLFFLVVFWFFLFFVGRVSFYLCIIPLLREVPTGLLLQSFYQGLRLDLSAAGYLTAVPFLLLNIYYYFPKRYLIKVADSLVIVFILIYVFTAVGEACVYREWKSKLSVQALQHFMHPSEVFKTTSLGLTILFFGLSTLLSLIFIRIYIKKVSLLPFIPLEKAASIFSMFTAFVVSLTVMAFTVISIRGGLQAIPIQSSDAFFCAQPIANDASVNPFWNIAFNIIDYENHFKTNPFKDFEIAEAQKIVDQIYETERDSTISILQSTRPNIVFLLMESWTAHMIKSFGGDDFAPFLDSLSRQGIRFTKFYPTAYVSDQGIPAILSGYPAVSRISVINQNSKSAKLPCINQDLKKYGYQSGFFFGGDMNYGNIKSYIFNKAFDVIMEEKDFDNSLERGKLGIQDGDMQRTFLEYVNKAKPPFVYAWFTLSTHMPYDFPGEKKQIVNHKENDFVNSIGYADRSFRDFFNEAKKQDWYRNTLFVIVADHGHADHKDFSVYDPEYHRIPFILFGDVIKPEFRGKEIADVFSQLDITTSLLKQMDLDEEAKQYVWGKNMLNPYSKHLSYFCSFAGGGVVTNNGYLGYQHGLDDLIINSYKDNKTMSDSLLKIGKAFQQTVFEDYRLK